MREKILAKSPLKGLKLIAITVPFVATGIWMAYEEPVGSFEYRMAWFGICFFGLGILIGLFNMLDRRPQIVIDEDGIWDRSTRQDKILWDQIISAYPIEISKQKFIALLVDDTFVFKGKQYRWAENMNKALGAQKINLMVSQFKVEAHILADFINEIIAVDSKQRDSIIKKYFDE